MQKKRIAKVAVLVGVWAYAGATWASIGHHLVGLPDLALVAAVGCAMGAVAWMLRPTRSSTSELPTVSAKEPAAAR